MAKKNKKENFYWLVWSYTKFFIVYLFKNNKS
jgi:hypothetical protein